MGRQMGRQICGLTPRELDVVITICSGVTRKEAIAAELEISPPTVRTHFRNIYSKLAVVNLAELVLHVLYNPALNGVCFPRLKVKVRHE